MCCRCNSRLESPEDTRRHESAQAFSLASLGIARVGNRCGNDAGRTVDVLSALFQGGSQLRKTFVGIHKGLSETHRFIEDPETLKDNAQLREEFASLRAPLHCSGIARWYLRIGTCIHLLHKRGRETNCTVAR